MSYKFWSQQICPYVIFKGAVIGNTKLILRAHHKHSHTHNTHTIDDDKAIFTHIEIEVFPHKSTKTSCGVNLFQLITSSND